MDKQLLREVEKLCDRLLSGDAHLSHSSFSAFMTSPAHFIEYKFGERESSASMDTGTLVHTILLEPKTFDEKYAVFDAKKELPFPGKDYRTKANREARDSFIERHPGKKAVEKSMIDEVHTIVERVRSTSYAQGLLNLCDTFEEEKTFNWQGFTWKGIKDASCEELIVDLKTAKDASMWGFRRSIRRYGYHRQAALYSIADCNIEKPYFIIAVETNKPYAVGIHHITKEAKLSGKGEIEKALVRFRECLIDPTKFAQSYEFWAKENHGIFEVIF